MSISGTLADYLDGYTLEDVPERYIDDARVLLLDYLGVAIRGSRTSSGRIVASWAESVGGAPDAFLVASRGRRVPAHEAAFANAIASHSVELDDVDVLALFHFSPPVYSAALAVAQRVKANGAQFLRAALAGCEVMARVSNAANPSLRNRGFHTTPTAGVFGAAVAAGLLEGLSREQMISALALAGAQSSGLMEMYGPSMQKRFNPGPAARNGVVAASLAKAGFTGASTIFEGQNGWLAAFTDDASPHALTQDLGTAFHTVFEYKPYSSARPIHNGVDAALAIREVIGAERVSDIVALHVDRDPAWASYHLNGEPATYHEAQVSLPYSIAVALTDGAALLDQYDEEHLASPEVGRLSRLLTVSALEGMPRGVSLRLTATLADGTSTSVQVDSPRGSVGNPMTKAEIESKFRMLAEPIIGRVGAQRLVDSAASVLDLETVDELLATQRTDGEE